MSKEYVAKESTSQTILTEIRGYDMTGISVFVGDYVHDNPEITSGGVDTYARKLISA